MNNIIIILLCLPLYVANSFSDKYVSAKCGTGYSGFYNWIKFLSGSVLLLPLFVFDKAERFGLGAILCGFVCGIMFAASKMAILKGYEQTSVTFMTICHSSGMIVPCLIGALFWNEPLKVLSMVGILLVVASVVLLKDANGTKNKYNLCGILCGAVVFVGSGLVMVCQKLMGIYFANQSVNAYNFYSFVVAFLVLSFSKGRGQRVKPILPFALLSAVSLVIVSVVMTLLSNKVPSAVMFPLFNGLGIILVSLGSIPVFKEKLTCKKLAGLILGVLGLCLINI